jgi:Ca2+/Na+ antiporter
MIFPFRLLSLMDACLLGSKMIADGSELLLEILDPGLIGGLVLPVLGALPDALIILVSCLGGTQEQVQQQVAVGVGTLAGSTIMLLTVPFAGSLLLGRCDIIKGKAKDKTLTRTWDPVGTGVTTDGDVPWNAIIMMGTGLTYIVVQGPAFVWQAENWVSAATAAKVEGYFALAGFFIAATLFFAYGIYMVVNTKQQMKKMEEARKKLVMHRVLISMLKVSENKEARKHLEKFASRSDVLKDEETGRIIPDMAKFGGKWRATTKNLLDGNVNGEEQEPEHTEMVGASTPRSRSSFHQSSGPHSLVASLEAVDDASDSEAESESEYAEWSKSRIIMRSATLMIAGTAIVAFFSDPMVGAISEFAVLVRISPFYIAFVLTPIASNASELISSLLFAMGKKKRNASLTYGALYGAVTMNNTMCLAIFLFMVYWRGIKWDFSAEVSVILMTTAVVGLIGLRTTLRTFWALPVILMYPLSLAVVFALESKYIGWQ